MIRDPYEAPSTRLRHCGRRAFLTCAETEQAIALDGLDDETLASVARFRGLRALRLSTCEIGPLTVAALRSLTSLRELWLWHCAITASGLEDALASLPLRMLDVALPGALGLTASTLLPRCGSLESLSLQLVEERAAGLFDALAALPSLRWLSLVYAAQVTDETLPRLASLSTLEGLTLHGCAGVTGTTLDSLSSLQNLRALKLVSCEFAHGACERLASLRSLRALDLTVCKGFDLAPFLPTRSLEVLRLLSTQLSPEQIEAIGELAALTHLDLGSSGDLTDAMLRTLGQKLTLRGLGIEQTQLRGECFADTERWSQLEQLDASHSKLDDAAMANLAKLPKLKSAEIVYCTELTAKGVARVAEFPSLTELNAQGVDAVDDAMIDAWARRPRWDELTLYSCTKVSGRSVVPLMRAHPEVVVHCEPHRMSDRSLAASERYDEHVTSVELSDTSLAALVTPSSVKLVDRPSGTPRNKKSIPAKEARVCLDPKGRALVTVAKKARVWDATNGAELPELTFKLSRFDDAAFSADGSRFAIAGLGGTKKKPQRLVYLWDVATWTQLGTLEATHSEEPTRVALSTDGSHVVVAHASIEVLSVKSAERVLHIERPSPSACFDATGDAVLFLDEGSVMRAPLDGGAVTTVLSWRRQLERAGGVTVVSERAELAANPEFTADWNGFMALSLRARGADPVVKVDLYGSLPATGVAVGERAVWVQCDTYGDRASALSHDAKTLMFGYPLQRLGKRDGKVGAWPLDEVMKLASEV